MSRRSLSSRVACDRLRGPKKSWNRNGREQRDDRDDDHEFGQSESASRSQSGMFHAARIKQRGDLAPIGAAELICKSPLYAIEELLRGLIGSLPAHSGAQEFGCVCETELLFHSCMIGLDRLNADVHLFGDL